MNKFFGFLKDNVLGACKSKSRRMYEKFYFAKLRKRLKNKDFSLFSPNCYAGIIYHRLGLRFLSPTINMLFPVKKQYLKFVANLKYYIEKDLVFINDPDYKCPVAMLEDVKLVFNHYHTREEAARCWNERKKRINYDNVFIIFDDIADIEYSDILEFDNVKCAGKIVLTAKNYSEIPYAVQIRKYKGQEKLKAYLLDLNPWTGKNAADRDFDFVAWLNKEL